MFNAHYFGPAYFAPRYFPEVGGVYTGPGVPGTVSVRVTVTKSIASKGATL